MRFNQIQSYNVITENKSYKLWEGVGQAIYEAALTADQIDAIFQQVEQGATGAGDNRTVLGKGKDIAGAVQAAYDDLASKVQNSGPVKGIDAKYDQAAAQLKAATGGDAGVMKYVEKYREFAKAHPIAQSLIYSALIAAAGISGAGLGGAAALGLLKMTDKLLQGEKFSTAVGKGAETGAMAYAAGQIGKAMKGGDQGQTTTTRSYDQTTTGIQPASPWDIPDKVKKAYPLDKFTYKTDGIDLSIYDKAGKLVQTTPSMQESTVLSAALVKEVLDKTTQLSVLYESWLGDKAKAIGGAVAGKAQQVGHNLTTKVTANKLKSAWTQAGSPTDSNQLASFLKQQGVADSVIQQVFKSMKIKLAAPKAAGQQQVNVKSLMSIINTLNNRDKKRILAHLNKNLGTA